MSLVAQVAIVVGQLALGIAVGLLVIATQLKGHSRRHRTAVRTLLKAKMTAKPEFWRGAGRQILVAAPAAALFGGAQGFFGVKNAFDLVPGGLLKPVVAGWIAGLALFGLILVLRWALRGRLVVAAPRWRSGPQA